MPAAATWLTSVTWASSAFPITASGHYGRLTVISTSGEASEIPFRIHKYHSKLVVRLLDLRRAASPHIRLQVNMGQMPPQATPCHSATRLRGSPDIDNKGLPRCMADTLLRSYAY